MHAGSGTAMQEEACFVANDDCSESAPKRADRTSYRSVFISDTHLGKKGGNPGLLADFLKSVACQHMYLVGDIVDGWSLRKAWFWDHDHDRVVRRVIKMAKNGTEVTWIPGNHDEALRPWAKHFAMDVAGIRIKRKAIHVTADGERLLVTHGDEFDGVIRYAKWLAHLGDWAYDRALWLNRWFNVAMRRLGYPYWSLSQWLKHQVKEAVKFIDSFETAVADEARRQCLDGAVCGHIHNACSRVINGMNYYNCGDWVESCTALVEHHDGRIEIVDWATLSAARGRVADSVAEDDWQAETADTIPVLAAEGRFAHLAFLTA